MYALQETVVVKGDSFWGLPSQLTFVPNDNPTDTNWYWRPTPKSYPMVISPSIAQFKRNRIRLTHFTGDKQYFLEVCEHPLALRYIMGGNGLTIIGHGWPPFGGGARLYWEQLKPKCLLVPDNLPRYSISREVSAHHLRCKKGKEIAYPPGKASTTLHPLSLKYYDRTSLRVQVISKYPYMEQGSVTAVLPDLDMMEEVIGACTQGYSRMNWHYGLSRLATKCFGWPHHSNVVWPAQIKINPASFVWYDQWSQEVKDSLPGLINASKEVARQYALHRLQDFLGAAALICHNGLFVAYVDSRYSGHRPDMEAVTEAERHIVRVA